MRRPCICIVIVALLASMAAATAAAPYERKIGFLIPGQCKPVDGGKKPDGPYDDWPAPHTTECALREACIKSGYGIWSEDRFIRFDQHGQGIALEYFKSTRRTSYHKVEVTGVFKDEHVAVKKIELVD